MNNLLYSLTFLALISLGAGLQCYVCNSEQGDCETEALRDDILQTCEYKEGKTPFCRRQHLWLEEGVKDGSRVYRDCGYERREGFECYQKRGAGSRSNYIIDICQCEEDKCNSAHSIVASSVAAMALLTTLVVRLF